MHDTDMQRHGREIGELYTRTEDNAKAIVAIETGVENIEKNMEAGFTRIEKKIDSQDTFYTGLVNDIRSHNEKTIEILNAQYSGVAKKLDKMNGLPGKNADKIKEHDREIHGLCSDMQDINNDIRPVKQDYDDRREADRLADDRSWYQAAEIKIGLYIVLATACAAGLGKMIDILIQNM